MAISAWLVDPQSTVTMTDAPAATAASIAASDRPWPSSSRLGTYGSTATPNRRRASVMIVSPVRPSASKSPKTRTRLAVRPGSGQPRQQDVGIGQERRVVQSIERLGEPGVQVARRPRRRDGPAARPSGPRRRAPGPPTRSQASAPTERERPNGSAVRPRRQDATGRCTAALPPGCATIVRTPGAGPAGRASRRSGRGVGHPTGSSPRRSGSPRRSTRRSPR